MGRGGGSSSSSRSGGSRSRSSSGRSSSHGSRASFSSGRSRGYGGSSHASRSSSSSYKRSTSHDAPPRQAAPTTHRRGFAGFGYPRGGGHGGFIGYGNGAPRRSYAGGGGCGCLAGLAGLVAALVALVLFVPTTCTRLLTGRRTSDSTTSQTQATQQLTRTRDQLAADACIESDQWIDDQAGWLDDQQSVVDAMRSFYEQTGIQPYLVIADSIDGNKNYATGDAEQYLRERYDELYDDDGHLILLFCEPYENEYDPYLLVGTAAQQVVDTDGENIIYEAIDRWYTDKSLTDDEYFARIFVASANALMYGTSFDEFG